MKRPHAVCLLVYAVAAWFAAAPAPTAAQQPAPGLPFILPDTPVDLDAADRMLAQRFGKAPDRLQLARSVKKILENPKYYGISPKQVRDMFPDLVKRPGDFGIDPRDAEWRDLFQGVQLPPDQIPPDLPRPMDPRPMPGDPMPPMGGNPNMPMIDPNPMQPMGGGPGDPPPGNGGGGPQPPGMAGGRPEPAGANAGMTGRFREIMNNVIGRDSKLRDLARSISLDARRWTRNILPRLDGLRLNELTRGLGGILPRNLNLSLPRVALPSGRVNVPSVSVPSGGSLGSGLLVIVIGVLVGLLVWILIVAVKKWVPAELLARWRLGPWPVRPGAVSTRGELVKAFEYLALLNLGQSATANHHKDLAERLGGAPLPGPTPPLHLAPALAGEGGILGHAQGYGAPANVEPVNRREAAEELGFLYEQARYAPPDEDLSPHQLEAARHDLCLLAGVSAA